MKKEQETQRTATPTAQPERSAEVDKELKEIAELISEQLTPDKTAELVANICEETDAKELDGHNHFERILWIARRMYLMGFMNATENALLAQELTEGAGV